MNIFFPKRNTEFGFADWVNGDKRVLFIAGLSGSGKTTMANDLGEITEAKVIHLDQYLRPLIRSKFGENPDYERIFAKHGIELVLEDNPEGKLIIEGCHIAWFNVEQLKQHAVLCVNTSFLKSCYQAMRRSFSKKSFAKHGFKGIHMPIKFNLLKFKHVCAFSKLLIN